MSISDAHAALHEHRDIFRRLVECFRGESSDINRRVADALNSELRSILLSSFVCEFVLREIKNEIVEPSFGTDELHNLAHVFGTYAILACYNSLMIFKSVEVRHIISGQKQALVVEALNKNLPRIVDAGDAIRHHHDRIFSRVRNKKVGNNPLGQMIAHWGPTLKLTDSNMDEFYFEFLPSQVLTAIQEIIELLEK
jgi:hypothetical protein